MILLYNLLLTILLIVGWPYLLVKYLKNEDGWRERLGGHPRSEGRTLWIHACSVGEVNAVSPLVDRIRERCPWYDLLITTFTRTGKLRARQLYGDRVFYAPLDFSPCVSRSLSRIRPEALILVESELWPNFITMTRKQRRPVFVVNGRITPRSLARYKAFKRFIESVLNCVDYFMMQSEEHSRRVMILGADAHRVSVVGNLKSDLKEGLPCRSSMRDELGLENSDQVIVAGSTREGEEEMILEALAPLKHRLTLVLVPRHPDRIAKIEQIMENSGFTYRKRSEGNNHAGEVLLVDTIGELRSIYRAADIAFVGGSLLPFGGHNPLEAAACGIPVLFGPYMENAGSASLKERGGGTEVADPTELREAVVHFLDNPEEKLKSGASARRVLEEVGGASERTFSIILNELEKCRTDSEISG